MKKLITLVALVALAGCGGSSPTSPDSRNDIPNVGGTYSGALVSSVNGRSFPITIQVTQAYTTVTFVVTFAGTNGQTQGTVDATGHVSFPRYSSASDPECGTMYYTEDYQFSGNSVTVSILVETGWCGNTMLSGVLRK